MSCCNGMCNCYLEGLVDGYKLGVKRGYRAGYVDGYADGWRELDPPPAYVPAIQQLLPEYRTTKQLRSCNNPLCKYLGHCNCKDE